MDTATSPTLRPSAQRLADAAGFTHPSSLEPGPEEAGTITPTVTETLPDGQVSNVIERPRQAVTPRPLLPMYDKNENPTAAFSGLAGDFVRAVAPSSEADPVGILLHVLIGSGCLIGPGPHALVEHQQHHARLNAVIVGRTASGRKGTAWSHPRALFTRIDEHWTMHRVKSGLSSGEGMIYLVRDPDDQGDAGELDKRLLLIEPEFASTLKALQRQGNTLSPKIRDAWDSGNLSPLTKRERLTATGAHISVIAHSTQEELLSELATADKTNGFANRFLFCWVEKSKNLPHGEGAPRDLLDAFAQRFERVLTIARTRGELARDDKARILWAEVYPELNADRHGMTGAILSRAPAQVLRLSLIYALLDEQEADNPTPAIRPTHLAAALELWEYCEASAMQIFGDKTGDVIADRLLTMIKQGPQTDTDLWEAVKGLRCDGDHKERALDLLLRHSKIHGLAFQNTGGRPRQEWHDGTLALCGMCKKGNKAGGDGG